MVSLIEAIKRDRESGTPGPWKHGSIKGGWDAVVKDGETSAIAVLGLNVSVNATRISRLPDMEAALLAAEELAAKYRECLSELLSVYHSEFDGVWNDADFAEIEGRFSPALAAYRAATGARQ